MIVDIAWKTDKYASQIAIDVDNKDCIMDISKIFEGMKGRVTLNNSVDYVEKHLNIWKVLNPALQMRHASNEHALYFKYFTEVDIDDGEPSIQTLNACLDTSFKIYSLSAEVVTACNWLARNHGIVSLRMEK